MDAKPELKDLTSQCGEWLRGSGPESDIVISSRIRLARNLVQFPFIRRCTDHNRSDIEELLREKVSEIDELKNVLYLDVDGLAALDRQFLVERQLISRELAESNGARSVAIDAGEQYSLMINEEDHVRIQLMKSGLDLKGAWDQIRQIDDRIEQKVSYAWHDRLGYLTACPTNVGTGMRVSVMLHLPALVITRKLTRCS